MGNLAIALINHKGGVGKTTMSHILAQIALSQGLTVAAVDLDPQENFSNVLSLNTENPEHKKLTITNQLTDAADFTVVDCPPALNDATARAIAFADITLVPVMADIYSVSNLDPVYSFARAQEKSQEQTAIIKVGFDKRALVGLIATVLNATDYRVAGDVPINRLIPYNIAMGNTWEYRTSQSTREPYHCLYSNIWLAYKKMLEGDFKNAWKEV